MPDAWDVETRMPHVMLREVAASTPHRLRHFSQILRLRYAPRRMTGEGGYTQDDGWWGDDTQDDGGLDARDDGGVACEHHTRSQDDRYDSGAACACETLQICVEHVHAASPKHSKGYTRQARSP